MYRPRPRRLQQGVDGETVLTVVRDDDAPNVINLEQHQVIGHIPIGDLTYMATTPVARRIPDKVEYLHRLIELEDSDALYLQWVPPGSDEYDQVLSEWCAINGWRPPKPTHRAKTKSKTPSRKTQKAKAGADGHHPDGQGPWG